jgi:hypothetical protein
MGCWSVQSGALVAVDYQHGIVGILADERSTVDCLWQEPHQMEISPQHRSERMSGRYLYCQNCNVYLGSLGADECHLCGWVAGNSQIFSGLLSIVNIGAKEQ